MSKFLLLAHRSRRLTLASQSPYRLLASYHSTNSTHQSPETPGEPPEKKEKKRNALQKLLPSEQLDAATRAIGQVLFLNSVDSGRVILLSLALGNPALAGCAALGAFTATATSQIIGLDNNAFKDGMWGYNGALIGCAASVFGPSSSPLVIVSTLLGAAATPVLSASLKSAMSMPQWTWSFNIVALTSLMRTRPLLAENGDGDQVLSTSAGLGDILMSPLLGISQIFVVGSGLTGAGIIAATYLYSPMLVAHALGGSTTGCLVGLMSGTDISHVCMGLWGYNSALASMAVGAFFVHSRQTMVLSASSAAASAFLFGSMQVSLGEYGAPCLTIPFCSVASACYLLEGHIPGLKLAAKPHSPEKNC